MVPASDPRDPTERTPWPRPRRPRCGPAVKRRPAFRPELEPVEDRCLLSGYNVPIDLGTLFPRAINNLGQVVGIYNDPSGVSHAAIRQTDGTIVVLPDSPDGTAQAYELTPNPTNPNTHLAGPNFVKVVGVIWNSSGNEGPLAIWDRDSSGIWQLHEISSIMVTRYPASGDHPVSISNSGVVVGDLFYGLDASGNPIEHAFVWSGYDNNYQGGVVQDLHTLLTAYSAGNSTATVVMDATSAVPHLQVVTNATTSATCGWCASAVLTDWNDDHHFDTAENPKTTLASTGLTFANAMSDIGRITGHTQVNGKDSGVIWQFDGKTGAIWKNLGQSGGHALGPDAINHGGEVVGNGLSSSPVCCDSGDPWLWTGSGKFQDLNGLIPKNSVWAQLDQAYGINDSGWIVGYGGTLTSGLHGFLMTPTTATTAVMTTSSGGVHDAIAPGQTPLEALVLEDLDHPQIDGLKGRRTPTVELR